MPVIGGIIRRKVIIEASILSAKYGGTLSVRSYCLYFQDRPPSRKNLLCVDCPDSGRCSKNTQQITK